MKQFISVCYLLLFFLFDVNGQADVKKIDKYIQQALTDWGVPGMSVSIVKDGKVVLNKGYGVRKSGVQDKVDEHTLFAIASNTKAFVSSSLADMVSEGNINWDDRVTDYLPYFELYDPYVSKNATIRDLLCHRLGLGTFSGDVIWYKSTFSAEEVIRHAKYVPQAYPFRAGYGYSNLMFITAGEVIKSVSGKSWDEYVSDNFFMPLGMERTITSVNQLNQKGNYASPHKTDEQSNKPISWVNWDNMGAAGGIISSANDMSKWMMMNLDKGKWNGVEILDSKQQNILWTPHNNFVMSEGSKEFIPGRHFNGYGLGWGLYDYYGNMVVTHSGGYDGMYSRVALVPDENLGVTILTNSMSGITNPLVMYIINAYTKDDNQDWSAKFLERSGDGISGMVRMRKEARKTSTQPTLSIDDYTGTFNDPFYGDIIVSKNDEQLLINFKNAPDLSASLQHWHYDTYEIKWDQVHAWFDFGTVRFVFDNNLEVTGIEFDVPNYDIFFDEIHAKKLAK